MVDQLGWLGSEATFESAWKCALSHQAFQGKVSDRLLGIFDAATGALRSWGLANLIQAVLADGMAPRALEDTVQHDVAADGAIERIRPEVDAWPFA